MRIWSRAEGNQETQYVYGTNIVGITPAVYRNDLLRAVIYPDSDDTVSGGSFNDNGEYDRVEYRYNRQGDRIQLKDQNQTVHDYDLDKLGRLLADKVTLPQGSAIDDAVLRIERTYEVRGMLYELTSYDAATSGNVVNQVVREYNDLGLLLKEHQEHDGQKDGNTLYVQYDYDETASGGVLLKGMRPIKLTYPNGRLLHFVYDSGADDNLGRITSLADDNGSGSPGTDLAEYTYLGLGSVVKVDYTEADLLYNLAHGASEAYDGLDRFGRVVDLLWRDYGSSADAVRIKHGYDRPGNRLWREDPVAAAASVDQDEFYSYDGVYQLTEFQRGNLTGSPPTGVTSLSYYEDWTLDPTGNWTEFFEDDNDDHEILVLDQDRDHNKANEIEDISEQTGEQWATPAHDAAGNMTTMPQPSQPLDGFACTFDAWNRLVKVVHAKYPQMVYGQYGYDGQHRRTAATAGGSTRHFYHSDRWQVLEERIGSSSTAECQYVWGTRYIDDLVLRDRDSDSDAQTGSLGKSGSGLDQRLYALQDPNYNVVAIAESDGDIAQRYRYDAYGKYTKLSPSFGYTATNYAWRYLYTGREHDPETNFLHYRNRYYHTGLGRFISRDPIRYRAGDRNLYRYVGNTPLTTVDPSGTDIVLPDMSGIPSGVTEAKKNCCLVKSFRVEKTRCHIHIGEKDHPFFYGQKITVSAVVGGEQTCCQFKQFRSGHIWIGDHVFGGETDWHAPVFQAGEAVEEPVHVSLNGDTFQQTIYAGIDNVVIHSAWWRTPEVVDISLRYLLSVYDTCIRRYVHTAVVDVSCAYHSLPFMAEPPNMFGVD